MALMMALRARVVSPRILSARPLTSMTTTRAHSNLFNMQPPTVRQVSLDTEFDLLCPFVSMKPVNEPYAELLIHELEFKTIKIGYQTRISTFLASLIIDIFKKAPFKLRLISFVVQSGRSTIPATGLSPRARAWRTVTTLSAAAGVVAFASVAAASEPVCSADNPLLSDAAFPLFDKVKS